MSFHSLRGAIVGAACLGLAGLLGCDKQEALPTRNAPQTQAIIDENLRQYYLTAFDIDPHIFRYTTYLGDLLAVAHFYRETAEELRDREGGMWEQIALLEYNDILATNRAETQATDQGNAHALRLVQEHARSQVIDRQLIYALRDDTPLTLPLGLTIRLQGAREPVYATDASSVDGYIFPLRIEHSGGGFVTTTINTTHGDTTVADLEALFTNQ
ncbi:hypothetical protein J4464_00800 [Candidatus Woesearchaeota archaeon]|nr:hypothetical protein [Candidatus Woesearchaeota archaeon]